MSRSLASQLIAEYPGEILMMNDIKMVSAEVATTMHVLMMVDKFSYLTEFVPSESPTSIVVDRAVVHWSAQRGLPL